MIKARIEQLRSKLSKNDIDTFMVLVEENRRYLSGFTGTDGQFDESSGALFITESKLILATDSRFKIQAGEDAPLFEIFCYKKSLSHEIGEILSILGTKRLGFESIRLSYEQHEKIFNQIKKSGLKAELVETKNIVEDLRVKKDINELKEIRKALFIAESIFKDFKKIIIPKMTEKEAAWTIEKSLREAGADSISFPVIAASGPNSALPHAIPGDRKFMEGEPLLFDWGARLNGYCSDISRTIIIGKSDNTFKKVFQTVLEAQIMAIESIKPGINSKSVDETARKHIERMGFKDNFGHGLGHGTGLAVHEPPRISPLSDAVLEPGMVFTVEPGIYIKGWGGVRLENQVVVTQEGCEVLNSLDASDFQIWR